MGTARGASSSGLHHVCLENLPGCVSKAQICCLLDDALTIVDVRILYKAKSESAVAIVSFERFDEALAVAQELDNRQAFGRIISAHTTGTVSETCLTRPEPAAVSLATPPEHWDGPLEPRDDRTVHCSSLLPTVRSKELIKFGERIGPVYSPPRPPVSEGRSREDAEIVKRTSKFIGQGRIVFRRLADAQRAITELDQTCLDGGLVTVRPFFKAAGPASTSDRTTIYLGNIAIKTSQSILRSVLGRYGPLARLDVVTKRRGDTNHCFGFLEYRHQADALGLLQAKPTIILDGRTLVIGRGEGGQSLQTLSQQRLHAREQSPYSAQQTRDRIRAIRRSVPHGSTGTEVPRNNSDREASQKSPIRFEWLPDGADL